MSPHNRVLAHVLQRRRVMQAADIPCKRTDSLASCCSRRRCIRRAQLAGLACHTAASLGLSSLVQGEAASLRRRGCVHAQCGSNLGYLATSMPLEAVCGLQQGEAAFLLATDVAARGLDILGVDAVINYDAPGGLSGYLHRIGRTARAGAAGRAVTFAEDGDRFLLKEARPARLEPPAHLLFLALALRLVVRLALGGGLGAWLWIPARGVREEACPCASASVHALSPSAGHQRRTSTESPG